MADANVTRLGQVNLAGDPRALFYKLFTGEVLTAFDRTNIMLSRHRTRSISGGKSAGFANTGRAVGRYHTPGTEINGQNIKGNETVITIDDLLISDCFTGVSGTTRFLGRMNVKPGDSGLAGSAFTHPVHLDHVCKTQGVYDSTFNRTAFSLPFPLGDPLTLADVVLVRGNGWSNKGTIETPSGGGAYTFVTGNSGYTIYLGGNWSGKDVFFGLKYDQAFTFSEQFYQANQRAGLNCRLQLRNMSVSFQNTGYFTAKVTIRGHATTVEQVVTALTSTYTARTVGDDWFRLNVPQLATGVYRFPVLAKSSDAIITLTNDSYLPCNFQTAEWEGMVTTRTR